MLRIWALLVNWVRMPVEEPPPRRCWQNATPKPWQEVFGAIHGKYPDGYVRGGAKAKGGTRGKLLISPEGEIWGPSFLAKPRCRSACACGGAKGIMRDERDQIYVCMSCGAYTSVLEASMTRGATGATVLVGLNEKDRRWYYNMKRGII